MLRFLTALLSQYIVISIRPFATGCAITMYGEPIGTARTMVAAAVTASSVSVSFFIYLSFPQSKRSLYPLKISTSHTALFPHRNRVDLSRGMEEWANEEWGQI